MFKLYSNVGKWRLFIGIFLSLCSILQRTFTAHASFHPSIIIIIRTTFPSLSFTLSFSQCVYKNIYLYFIPLLTLSFSLSTHNNTLQYIFFRIYNINVQYIHIHTFILWMINAIFLLSPVSTPYSYIQLHTHSWNSDFMFTFIIRIRNYYLSFMKWALNGNWCHCEALKH